jgi:hypothetical protein
MKRFVSKDGTILEQVRGSQWVKLYMPNGTQRKVIAQLSRDNVETIVIYSAQPIEQVRKYK